MRERRSELRFGADQPATVSALGPPRGPEIPGQIVEASKSGLRIILAVPIEAGTRIEVRWESTVLIGETRYCRQNGSARYCIGLRIAEVRGHGKLRTQFGAA